MSEVVEHAADQPVKEPVEHSVERHGVDSTVGLAASLIVVVALATLPFWDSDGSLRTPLVIILIYLALAQMWNLLAGYAGLISIGQQMFVGIGTYSLLMFAEVWGVDPWLSVGIAGVVAAAISLPVAWFAFRLTGGYFAIATWVIAEVVRLLVNESNDLRGGEVRSLTRSALGGYARETRDNLTYWLALSLAVGATAIVVLILRGRIGLALQSVRDSAAGARGVGVRVTRTKLMIWVIAAFWTGMVGAVILLNAPSATSASAFSVSRWTALVIFIVVIGGVGSPIGPIFGVLIFWFLDEQLGESDTWRLIILGGLAAVMAIVAPNGINGLIQKRRSVHFFPVRRHLVTDGE